MDKITIKKTADGAHTLYLSDLDETYHSIHGAVNEAKHVFLNAGLLYLKTDKIKILEIGFGTGLNAFLTYLVTLKKPIIVEYDTIEPFPLDKSIFSKLNYTSILDEVSNAHIFNSLHKFEFDKKNKVTEAFSFRKIAKKIEEVSLSENFYDLIYFDAFGPRVQPNMWTVLIFEKMYKCLKNNGVLVTYCAKGEVKRTLKKIGFKVETLPGPPGKREMTRAIKI